jgi:hypothetical protein
MRVACALVARVWLVVAAAGYAALTVGSAGSTERHPSYHARCWLRSSQSDTGPSGALWALQPARAMSSGLGKGSQRSSPGRHATFSARAIPSSCELRRRHDALSAPRTIRLDSFEALFGPVPGARYQGPPALPTAFAPWLPAAGNERPPLLPASPLTCSGSGSSSVVQTVQCGALSRCRRPLYYRPHPNDGVSAK